MKLTPFKFNGVTYYLLLNGAALFDIYDQFGDKGSVLDHIKGNSRSAFEAICWYLEELATQGELLRRHMGHDRQTVPSVDLFMTLLSPLDVSRARAALYSAIASGFGRETEQPREVDKGLLQLEKKNGRRLTRSQYLNAASQFLGLSVKEALLLPVELVLDMVEVEINRHRPKEERNGR